MSNFMNKTWNNIKVLTGIVSWSFSTEFYNVHGPYHAKFSILTLCRYGAAGLLRGGSPCGNDWGDTQKHTGPMV